MSETMNQEITTDWHSADTALNLAEQTVTPPLHAPDGSAMSCDHRGLPCDDEAPAIVLRAECTDHTDAVLLNETRAGNERAFEILVSRHHASMVRSAKRHVRDSATAEDVAQEAWMAFLESLDRFKGRCSIKTWLFRILINKAKTRGATDSRYVPLSALAVDEDDGEGTVDPMVLLQSSDPDVGCETLQKRGWKSDPEQILLDKEVRDLVRRAITDLPAAQGDVIDMRDVRGFSAKEVCDILGLTEINQRVLLHRARSRVRAELAKHLT